MKKTFCVVAVMSLCLALWVMSCCERSDNASGSDDVSSGARQTTRADLEALPLPCGVPVNLWNADNTPNQEAFDLLTARLSGLPGPGPDSFYTATRDLYAVDVKFGMDFVKRMGILFDGPRLRQEDYRRCLARIRSTPRAEVQKWAVELRRLAPLPETDHALAMLAWELTVLGDVYDGSQYDPQKAGTYLRRLEQLSPDSLDLWMAKLPAFSQSDAVTNRIDSAVAIVLTEAVRHGGRQRGQ